MAFNAKARILLELGAELISSDAIALYELIKNSLDAGSTRTSVNVVVVLQHSNYLRLKNLLRSNDPRSFDKDEFISEVESAFEQSAPEERQQRFIEKLHEADTLAQMREAFDDAHRLASRLDVIDNGHGMALSELRDVYLTLGTPARLLEKRALFDRLGDEAKDPRKIPLGDKGIGRLAVMRIGDVLEVRTARRADRKWNLLSVNWGDIKQDANLDLSDVDVEPSVGKSKEHDDQSGTRVRVRLLLSDWSNEKLSELAKTDFAKLFDPLTKGVKRDDIRLSFNGNAIFPPVFEHDFLKHADAKCSGRFRILDGEPILSGTVEYSHYKKEKSFTLTGEHLASVLKEEPGRPSKKKKLIPNSNIVMEALNTVGPFEWEFHWFNRGRLQREDSDVWQQIRPFVALWSGGLLVYRNAYRVYPYGAADDDWLDLDRKALASSSYKLNRAQIIGRLKISSRLNPCLQDQTNREGLRDTPEKHALVRMLRHVIVTECRTFLEDVSDATKPIDKDELENIERRLDTSQREAIRRIRDIGRRVPDEKQTVDQLLDYLKDVTLAWERAKEVAQTFESELEKFIHLAGVGLMVEFIAHELTRATQNALAVLDDKKAPASSMEVLRAQLKTIEKRLRILDPVSVPGRQRRANQDVRPIIEEVLEAHQAQFDRHQIKIKRDLVRGKPFEFKVEKGQIIQIIENLIANSAYWLREKAARTDYSPSIRIHFDAPKHQIHISDNGPGIPASRGEEVFTPFFTTKPPGKGRGLGLYIAMKLAEYNDATLELEDADASGIHRGFVLTFKEPRG